VIRVRRIVLVMMLLTVASIALVACGPSKAEVAAQQKEQCFTSQRQLKLALGVIYADSGIYPDVQDAANKLGAKCPSGGTYSFDPSTDTVSCSVHGHP
jgi:hypothetical protein